MQARRTTNTGPLSHGAMNNTHMMSGAMINSGGMSNRPLGSVVQKRKQLHGGQRQTRPQQQSQQQRQQPQQPRQPQQQRWKPQQLTQTATRQRHQPSLSTSNDMHPLMTGADLSVSGLHEAQQPEPGAEIDEVDFDSFVTMPPEPPFQKSIGEQLLARFDIMQSTLDKMCEYLAQIIDLNQPPEDQVQDVQQNEGEEYVEGFDPGVMPY